VLRGARETLGDRSPEQVARSAGVSGRTIRRLELGEFENRPRAVTLDALAAFYGLRAGFLRELGAWTDLPDDEVAARLRETARETLGDASEAPDEDLGELAMRVARASAAARETPWVRMFDVLVGDEAQQPPTDEQVKGAGRDAEVVGLVRDFLTLDRRRQRLLLDIVVELRAASDAPQDG
jgi:transcriptional regulator with XRE-family HTH domain